MSFVAAAIGGAAVLGGAAISANAATSAAGQQANALNNATAQEAAMFNTSQADLSPYMTSGTAAQTALDEFLGVGGIPGGAAGDATFNGPAYAAYDASGGYTGGVVPGTSATDTPEMQAERQQIANEGALGIDSTAPGYGAGTQSFTAADLNANMAPNYAFSLAQGQGANENVANAAGGLLGGNALQGLNTFTQNYAQGAYQQAYQNYNTNLNNIYTRLSGVATTGENAAAGAGTNALTAGAQMAGTTAASGAATAGGTIGSANALSGGLSNAGAYGSLGATLNNNSTTATNAGFNTGVSGYQDAATSGPINPLTYGDNYG